MSSSPSASPGRDRRGVDSVLIVACIGIFQMGLGILAALIPVNLAHAGLPVSLSGLVLSAGSAGFLAGCLAAPAVISRAGITPSLVAAVAVSSATSLALWIIGPGAGWILLRGISGFASGIVFPILEAWLADRAPTGRRAAFFSLYQVTSRSVYALAQLSLAWVDPAAVTLFLAAAIAALFTPTPSLAVSTAAPAPGRRVLGAMLDVPVKVPAAAVASFAHGIVTASATSLLPIWAIGQGLPVERVALVLVGLQVSAILLQVPVGLVADRLERRAVMAGLALLGLALSVVAPTAPQWPPHLQPVLLGLWGASLYPLYSVAVAHMNDIASPQERVTWGGSLLVIWGIGATLGPVLTGAAMDAQGPGALFAWTALADLALFAFLVWRLNARRRARGKSGSDLPLDGPP